jgi:hypothetical protein
MKYAGVGQNFFHPAKPHGLQLDEGCFHAALTI